MRATYSYEGIMRAVGRVLDQTDVREISMHETDEGLVIEGVNREGNAHVRLTYGLGDLCDMIDRTEGGNVAELFETTPATEAYTLREFLARHEAVTAR